MTDDSWNNVARTFDRASEHFNKIVSGEASLQGIAYGIAIAFVAIIIWQFV